MSKWHRVDITDEALGATRKRMRSMTVSEIRKMFLDDLNIQDRVKFSYHDRRGNRSINFTTWKFKFKCPFEAMAFKLKWS